MLVASLEGERVEAAANIERGSPYACPECSKPVILKAGEIKIPHFAHKVDLGCAYLAGETPAHLGAKRVFCDAMRARGLRVEPEYKITDQRADLAAWSPSGRLFVLEMQHTPISAAELLGRVRKYREKGIPQLWFPFLRNIQQTGEQQSELGAYRIRYAPRDFERELIRQYNGRLWYYRHETGLLHLSCWANHYIHVEVTDFGGGYSYPSKRFVGAMFSRGFAPADIRFKLTDKLLGVEPHFGADE